MSFLIQGYNAVPFSFNCHVFFNQRSYRKMKSRQQNHEKLHGMQGVNFQYKINPLHSE